MADKKTNGTSKAAIVLTAVVAAYRSMVKLWKDPATEGAATEGSQNFVCKAACEALGVAYSPAIVAEFRKGYFRSINAELSLTGDARISNTTAGKAAFGKLTAEQAATAIRLAVKRVELLAAIGPSVAPEYLDTLNVKMEG